LKANDVGRNKNSGSLSLGGSTILNKSPAGLSLAQRQREARMPRVTVTLDDDAHGILVKAAAYRKTTIERLCANVLMGTAYLGDINTQTAKVYRFRELGVKAKLTARMSAARAAKGNKDSNRDIAESADATPAQGINQ